MNVDALLRSPSADGSSQADRAYHAIRDLIVSLELRPGSVINERELMERIGHSSPAAVMMRRGSKATKTV